MRGMAKLKLSVEIRARGWLTVKDVSEILQLSDRDYHRAARLLIRREIPHLRVSLKDTRVPIDEFERWYRDRMTLQKP